MKEQILKKISDIEKLEDIRILFASESGSRAWGFPSPDSDYDVRIIYIHREEWYLSVYAGRDVIETPLADNFDINGWDLKKALTLLDKSNSVIWEWLQSPILYKDTNGFRQSLLSLAEGYFSPKSSFHHYFSASKKAIDSLGDQYEVKLKKLFYIIRPLLAARWIADSQTVPPMDLRRLLSQPCVQPRLKEEIESLVEKKECLAESELVVRSSVIDEMISEYTDYLNLKSEGIVSRKSESEPLDEFFRKWLKLWI